jgi:serine-type D-Ala-D-Ala carboxypeptidase/endopeptidase (penicillin-binding protein 4)
LKRHTLLQALKSACTNAWPQKIATALTTVLLTVLTAQVQSAKAAICPDELATRIDGIVSQPKFASARWGIMMQPLGDSMPLYSRNAEQFVIPASNVKLLTTSAALRMAHNSPPQELLNLIPWIRVINLNSDNASADSLLRRIGGQQSVREALTPLGVSPSGYAQVDGSGLSRQNQAKPATFVTLLQAMYVSDEGSQFYSSLPTSGIDGTLRNRFLNTPLVGRVHAKTGTLTGVRALSGYLENPYYGTIVFSIVVNQSGQSGDLLRQTIDQIVLESGQVMHCETP